ncbi:MAG: beta-lactamase family protein [Lewinella sp.]|nr:beta-lactamase family protein [Lewinella sp.]
MTDTIINYFLALLVGFAFWACEKAAPFTLPDQIGTPAELTAVLSDIQAASGAPGFAVAVIRDDSTVYQHAFGWADLATGHAYSTETIQPIGSISKTFVAAAVVKAVEQGYFTLETDINDILPVTIVNPHQPGQVIRVRHLVTHTAGLLDADEAYLQAYHILPGEDTHGPGAMLLQDLGVGQRPAQPLADFLAGYYLPEGAHYAAANFSTAGAGLTWAYSNIATSLAAWLVESVSGLAFDEYVQTYVFQPLAMQHSGYDQTELPAGELATLYFDAHTPLPAYGNDSYPDGSVHTSCADLSKFLADMMAGARGTSTTLFAAESYATLFQPLLPDGLVPAEEGQNQGIFWFLGEDTIRHDGSDPGTTCELQFSRSGQTGYLLLTNMDASTMEHALAYQALAERVRAAVALFAGS